MLCQHPDCVPRISDTGLWCRACIEREWPRAAWGDGKHWIVWKGVNPDDEKLGRYTGAAGCPYRLGATCTPEGTSNWLLSPLEAITEPYGTRILAARIQIAGCHLGYGLILDHTGSTPVLPLTVFRRDDLPSAQKAASLLTWIDWHASTVDAIEAGMARMATHMTATQTDAHRLRHNLHAAMMATFPDRLAAAERTEGRDLCADEIARAVRMLSATACAEWLDHYLDRPDQVDVARYRSHGELLLQLAARQNPVDQLDSVRRLVALARQNRVDRRNRFMRRLEKLIHARLPRCDAELLEAISECWAQLNR